FPILRQVFEHIEDARQVESRGEWRAKDVGLHEVGFRVAQASESESLPKAVEPDNLSSLANFAQDTQHVSRSTTYLEDPVPGLHAGDRPAGKLADHIDSRAKPEVLLFNGCQGWKIGRIVPARTGGHPAAPADISHPTE